MSPARPRGGLRARLGAGSHRGPGLGAGRTGRRQPALRPAHHGSGGRVSQPGTARVPEAADPAARRGFRRGQRERGARPPRRLPVRGDARLHHAPARRGSGPGEDGQGRERGRHAVLPRGRPLLLHGVRRLRGDRRRGGVRALCRAGEVPGRRRPAFRRAGGLHRGHALLRRDRGEGEQTPGSRRRRVLRAGHGRDLQTPGFRGARGLRRGARAPPGVAGQRVRPGRADRGPGARRPRPPGEAAERHRPHR
jgi:hypothetical protein